MKSKKFRFVLLTMLLSFALGQTVFASGGTVIDTAFDTLYSLISTVVSSIGAIVTLWGFFQTGIAMNGQDGASQATSFSKIGGGLLMLIVPQIIPIIQNAVGVS